MRLLFGAAALACLVTAVAAQDPRARVYSRPTIPSDAALRRLNLTVHWRGAVPMDTQRDGFRAVQLNRRDLFALTRTGLVCAFDNETGRLRWKTRIGRPY